VDRSDLEALIEAALTDAYGREEEQAAWAADLEDGMVAVIERLLRRVSWL
jgi:hypothetical protein